MFRECATKGVKGIVLITAGFKEIDDPAGTALHEEIAGIANDAGIPVIGPNTFGMINLRADLNASFTPEFSRLMKGSIALVSQSGGMSHVLGFLAMRMDVGFSKIIGLGNRLNVDFDQAIDYLVDDPDTKVIMLYFATCPIPDGPGVAVLSGQAGPGIAARGTYQLSHAGEGCKCYGEPVEIPRNADQLRGALLIRYPAFLKCYGKFFEKKIHGRTYENYR